MAGIEVTNTIKLPDIQKNVEQEFSALLEEAITEIRIRTQSGRDKDGKQFKPYSEAYKKKRFKKGRNTRPDLLWSGAMLTAINQSVDKRNGTIEGTIFFNSSREALKAKGNIENGREFFGFSREQITRITKKLSSVLLGRNK